MVGLASTSQGAKHPNTYRKRLKNKAVLCQQILQLMAKLTIFSPSVFLPVSVKPIGSLEPSMTQVTENLSSCGFCGNRWLDGEDSKRCLAGGQGCSTRQTPICSWLFAAERFRGSPLTLQKEKLVGNSGTC